MASSDDTVTNAEAEETATLDEVREIAKARGVPGPDVDQHDDGYDGECYCMSCCEYMR